MNLFIKFLFFIVILAIAGPFFMKGPDGKPLMSFDKLGIPSFSDLAKLSSAQKKTAPTNTDAETITHTSGGETFYKWQDQYGIWQFTTTPPPSQPFETVETDPNANVIQSLSKDTIDTALGRVAEVSDETAKTGESEAEKSPLEELGGLSPTTVPITKIPKLLDDAKNVQNIMDQHAKQLEKL